jgi:hypothetical protein
MHRMDECPSVAVDSIDACWCLLSAMQRPDIRMASFDSSDTKFSTINLIRR